MLSAASTDDRSTVTRMPLRTFERFERSMIVILQTISSSCDRSVENKQTDVALPPLYYSPSSTMSTCRPAMSVIHMSLYRHRGMILCRRFMIPKHQT